MFDLFYVVKIIKHIYERNVSYFTRILLFSTVCQTKNPRSKYNDNLCLHLKSEITTENTEKMWKTITNTITLSSVQAGAQNNK